VGLPPKNHPASLPKPEVHDLQLAQLLQPILLSIAKIMKAAKSKKIQSQPRSKKFRKLWRPFSAEK
jgi:hypothetical protein